MKILTALVLGLLLLFSGSFAIEGRLTGCSISGLVSASTRQRSLTILAVNYRPGRTYYNLVAR